MSEIENPEQPKVPNLTIHKIPELMNMALEIPAYQRPYKWKQEHVTQLLDDILVHCMEKDRVYRIGSVILHEEEKETDPKIIYNIVDGQQRLTTIAILLKLLEEIKAKPECKNPLLKKNYKSQISKDNIVYNYQVIQKWLSKFDDAKQTTFKQKLLEKCQFVVFTVFDQDEAFQLFDSQNSRGRSLEPYDLLKAFHLREMQHDTQEERMAAVKLWEKAIEAKELKPIFSDHLFRIRKWSKNERVYYFTKDDIGEFKGLSLYQKQRFPHETALRMLDRFVADAQRSGAMQVLQVEVEFPFGINMPIINGKRFFEYVEHYIRLKKELFGEKRCPEFHAFFTAFCEGKLEEKNLNYEKFKRYKHEDKGKANWYDTRNRLGDQKVKNLYGNMVLLFVDRFGYEHDFKDFYEAFYKLAFAIRCKQKPISAKTILIDECIKLFGEINHAIEPDKLSWYRYNISKVPEVPVVFGIEPIIKFINGLQSPTLEAK